MIFGFNTDVKAADNTIYHVQSEARVNDLLLQTQVFVKGHCIGKRASSYAERTVQPAFSTEEMHQLLKAQHRMMLEAVKEGRMQDVFCSDGEVQDVNAGGLAVKWLNADAVFQPPVAILKLRVADRGTPADGALLTSRLSFAPDAHIHSQSMAEADGVAELEIEIPSDSANETAVLVRAKYGDDKSITRKFRLKRG
ncbi:MAG TPA: hypothetical protein VM056_07395 [Terriglobales bacterium]|nr:hypothetical protein [Terriglobales bacterium]